MAAIPGQRIVTTTIVTTIGFVVSDVVALSVGGATRQIFVVYCLVMFALGCAAFLWAFAIAIKRSQSETVAVSTIYGLAGSKVRGVRLRLFGSLATQVAVGIGGAALQPFSSMAFGVLAPMFGIGMTGLWGARYGGGTPADRHPTEPSGRGVAAAESPAENGPGERA